MNEFNTIEKIYISYYLINMWEKNIKDVNLINIKNTLFSIVDNFKSNKYIEYYVKKCNELKYDDKIILLSDILYSFSKDAEFMDFFEDKELFLNVSNSLLKIIK